ncbi:MAG: LysR family transcriptional regulator [Eubacterium sp.]|nr:LysR family transcriptional regulator [Eubacterium sp.]
MDQNLQKYQAFIATVDSGSFTKAADILGYAQSSVSKMIADLESEWQVVLLERSRAGVQLTSDGMAMLPYARELVNSYRKVQEQAASISGVATGIIRIGTFSSVATHWIPSIIQRFQKDYPGIRYELLLGDYKEIEQWIFEGRVDCGFLRLPTKGECRTISLEKDEYVAVLPVGHQLTRKDMLDPRDLEGQPFMLLEHGGKTEVSELLEKNHVKPDIRFTTWDDYAILSMVESGLGIGILPRLILRRIPYRVEIRSFSEPFFREIGFAVKSGEIASVAVQKFEQYLKYRD